MHRLYRLISIVFHPVLLPIAATILFFILNNSRIDSESQIKIILMVAFGTYLIPVLLLVILKKRKLIENFEVRKINERKIPVLFMTILFFILAKSLGRIPNLYILSQLFIGCSISLSICYISCIAKLKISLHMIGISTFIGFIIIYSLLTQTNLLILISSLVMIAGLIAHSRLKLQEHSLKEVLLGSLIGVVCQFLVLLII